jgi:hypothetical protein
VPVIVTVAFPVAAVGEAVNLSVLVLVVDPGLKLAVTPEGKPLARSETDPVNPPLRATVMVLLAVEPRLIVSEEGFADKEKLGFPPPPESGN